MMKKNNVLTFSIKQVYLVNGQVKGIIPNEAINGVVKVTLLVPSTITDIHVKVIHKSGDKVIDERTYEIETDKYGNKYIVIETESFSEFEASFYTPVVANPQTGDNVIYYAILLLMSLLSLSIVVVKKHL